MRYVNSQALQYQQNHLLILVNHWLSNLIKQALGKINAYNLLISKVEEVRKQAFSWESNDNKQKLVELWEGLTNEKLEFKISKRWITHLYQ